MATNNSVNTSLSGQTGTGTFAGSTSPVFVTPTLGVAAATSINFGGTALNNYTEGTWTPSFSCSSVGDLSVSYATQIGNYTRIGRQLFLSGQLTCTPTFTTASGTIRITGLPFTSTDNGGGVPNMINNAITYPASTTYVMPFYSSSGFVQLRAYGSATAAANIVMTNIVSGAAFTVNFNVAYPII